MGSRKNINWLVVWDIYGLESLFNVTTLLEQMEQNEKSQMWNTLGGNIELTKLNIIPLKQLILRASFNTHRHYEIYTFNSSSLNESDIRYWFENTPQQAADWIRINGNKIFSNRETRDRVIT